MRLLAWNEKPITKHLQVMTSSIFAIAIASSICQKQRTHAQTFIHYNKTLLAPKRNNIAREKLTILIHRIVTY
jgi:hypothetical protein